MWDLWWKRGDRTGLISVSFDFLSPLSASFHHCSALIHWSVLLPTLFNRSKWRIQQPKHLMFNICQYLKKPHAATDRVLNASCVCVRTLTLPAATVSLRWYNKGHVWSKFQFPFRYQCMWPYTSVGLLSALEIWGYKKLEVKGFGGRGWWVVAEDCYPGKWPSDLSSKFSRTNTAGLRKLPVIICVYVQTRSASGRFSFVKSTLGLGAATDKIP